MNRILHWLRASGWLIGVFFLALAVRCVGLSWGGSHADENIGDAVRVLTGEIVPVYHYYPPLLNYLTAVGFVILFGLGKLVGWWSNVSEFRDAYFENPDYFLVVLRSVVAISGATAAPIGVVIAARLAISRFGSVMVGMAIALLPLSVWRSHIGKSDLGVAAGVLLVVWALVRYVNGFCRVDKIWIGVASAIAVSFKHSAVFLIGPLALAFLLIALMRGRPLRELAHDLLIVITVGIACWIPLNVGLWLDWRNFLEFQKVQTVMSFRDSTLEQTLVALWGLLGDRFSGPTLMLLVGFILLPVWWRRAEVLAVWVSVLVSVAIVAYISGERALVQLYTPHSVVIATLGMMAWMHLAARGTMSRWVGIIAAIAAAVFLASGTYEVLRQALSPSVRERVSQSLLGVEGIAKRRILASDPRQTGLPVSGDADREAMARHERLAARYEVKLPKRYRPYASNDNRYFILSFPWVIGGLEVRNAQDVKQIKPFAWPLQPEEWELDYWLQKGYTVFVVKNESAMLAPNVPAAYRNLHRAIRDRAKLISVIPADRHLFLEFETKIYVLDQAGSRSGD